MPRKTHAHPPDTSRLAKARLRKLEAATKQGMFKAWCRENGLPEPVPEYRFHGDRKWRFDYAFPVQRVAIEVHGGVYRQGHHTRGKGFLDDREKMAEAQVAGWKVFEVAPSGKHPNTLYSPQLLAWLKAVL